MPRVIVQTDDGRTTYDSAANELVLNRLVALRIPSVPHHATAHLLLGGLGRGIQDAVALEMGRDPERPSEAAMRMAAEADAHGDR